jgi:hypothetical protein
VYREVVKAVESLVPVVKNILQGGERGSYHQRITHESDVQTEGETME